MTLQAKIFLGLMSGAIVGGIARLPDATLVRTVVVALEPLGTAFIRLITMVVVPLVIASLFVGVASLGDVRRLGRIGGKTLAYFFGTTVVAATIGLVVARLAHLGQGVDASLRDGVGAGVSGAVSVAASGGTTAAISGGASAAPSFVQTLLAMVPQNPFAAAAQADLLPLIISVCIFGAAATVISEERRRPLVAFFEAVNDLAMVVIRWLMRLAPAAVFVLIAATVATSGLELLESLLLYAVVIVVAMAIHVALVLLPALRFGARLGIMSFFRSVSDALLLAFSTASSSVTLPVSMRAATERLGIPNEIASFVLPSGATLNKNGAAVYKAATAVFIGQLYGIELGAAQLMTIVLTATMASFAGAGIPGSSLVTTLIVLNAIGLGPHAAAGIALVVAVDRPLDMCRTTVNTIGNLVGTAWIGRSEGTRDRLDQTAPFAIARSMTA